MRATSPQKTTRPAIRIALHTLASGAFRCAPRTPLFRTPKATGMATCRIRSHGGRVLPMCDGSPNGCSRRRHGRDAVERLAVASGRRERQARRHRWRDFASGCCGRPRAASVTDQRVPSARPARRAPPTTVRPTLLSGDYGSSADSGLRVRKKAGKNAGAKSSLPGNGPPASDTRPRRRAIVECRRSRTRPSLGRRTAGGLVPWLTHRRGDKCGQPGQRVPSPGPVCRPRRPPFGQRWY